MLDEVSKLLHDFEIDVFGLSETKLDDDVDDAELTIPCYRLFRKDRNKSGGGVAMYVSSSLHVQQFCDPDRDDIEALWLKLFLRREVYQIGVVYQPRLNLWTIGKNSVFPGMLFLLLIQSS